MEAGGSRPLTEPSLSIIIPLGDAAERVADCLRAIEGQVDAGTEVIVAARAGRACADAVEHAHPWVRVVRGRTRGGVGELRATGLAHVRGEIVAFTDPCCRVSAGWVAGLRAQPWAAYAAVGGAVLPTGPMGPADWAAFLADYGWFLPPVRTGEVRNLPGNNVAFRRAALERAGLVGEAEFWKVHALERLSRQGERCWSDPDLLVHHQRSVPAREHIRRSYLNGRCFGGQRSRSLPWAERLARAVTGPALPLVLTARVVRAIEGKPGDRPVLWRTLPLIAVLQLAWSWGEVRGYLQGSGGACARLA